MPFALNSKSIYLLIFYELINPLHTMAKAITLKKAITVSGLSVFLFFASVLSAQTVLKGTISDSVSGEKLPGVIISIDSTHTAMSDIDGHYTIQVPAGGNKVMFTFLGYTTITQKFNSKGDTVYINPKLHSLEQEINPVVVTASMYGKNIARENVSMEVLKTKTIENTGATQVDEAMNNVPGVNVTYDGQANIRGGSGWTYGAGSRVLVLIDGLPELTADAGDVKWDFLPIEQVQQVEVIKGASSVQYGSSALDGVINLRTTVPGPTPQTTINVYEGIYGNPAIDSVPWKASQAPGFQGFTFMHSHQFGQFDLITSGEAYNETGYLQGEFTQKLRGAINARYRFKKIEGLIIGLKVNEMYNNESSYLAWANDKNGILNPFLGASTLVPGKYTREAIDPYITYYFSDGSKISLQGRYFVSDNQDYGSTNKGSRAQLRYSEMTYQKAFKHNFTLNAGLVASGNEVAAELYGSHEGTNLAAYAQLEKRIGRLILTGGIRKESFKEDSVNASSPLVYRAGANFELFKYTHIRASYGEGYRFPSVAERFIYTNVGGIRFVPNPWIEPEKDFGSEIGINQGFKIGTWYASADVAAFQTVFSKLIDFTFGYYYNSGATVPPGTQFYGLYLGAQSRNVESAFIKGLEVSLNSEGKILGLPVTFIADFTAINPINVDSLGKVNTLEANQSFTSAQKDSLKQITYLNYRSLYTAKVGFEVTCHKFTFGGNARYSSFQVNIDKDLGLIVPGINDFRETHHNGQTIFDAHIGYQATSVVKIAFIVKNLWNTVYTDRPGMLDPPRTFMVQSIIKF